MSPPNHDALFKSTFTNPARAMALVLSAFPEDVGRHFDVKGARLASGHYVGPALGQKHSDLVIETRLGKSKTFVYLLVEHQSEFDRQMPLRMLEYSLEIWRRFFSTSRWLFWTSCTWPTSGSRRS